MQAGRRGWRWVGAVTPTAPAAAVVAGGGPDELATGDDPGRLLPGPLADGPLPEPLTFRLLRHGS